MCLLPLICSGLIAGCQTGGLTGGWPDELLTTSERSWYQATETHAEVVALMDRIADGSRIARRSTMGLSYEGRELPLLILADPPVSTAEQAHASGKLIVYLQASIHGGEVCGKPALLQLAREIALNSDSPDRALLDDLILVMCPVYNADGNDRIKVGNRGPAQNGPAHGMGQRANAQGFDLNRDHMKLASPEARALVRFLNEWDPALTIDMHTTDGSQHRLALTYAEPQNPSGASAPIEYVRDQMLPEVSRRLESRTGLKTFFYGNFNREHTRWSTYSHLPRFATPYRGLRNRLSILSEAYAYSSYEERVIATREFVRECLTWTAEQHTRIAQLVEQADRATVNAPKGIDGQQVGIRFEKVSYAEPVTIPGYEDGSGKRADSSGVRKPSDYVVEHFGKFVPTLTVARPYAYLIPARLTSVVDKLREHGVVVERLAEQKKIDTETYTIESIERSDRKYQGHHMVTVEASLAQSDRDWPVGTWVVSMDQPLATLAMYLLEPESDDGLVTWGLLDEQLEEGQPYPIGRAMSPPWKLIEPVSLD